jgi:hypothetical protein
VAVGGTIFDPQGGEVGKIVSMTGDAVVVDTGDNKATLPKSAIGSGPKGPIIAMTKAQIDEQVAAANQKASAAVEAAMVTGAPVKGKAGGAIGTIKGSEGRPGHRGARRRAGGPAQDRIRAGRRWPVHLDDCGRTGRRDEGCRVFVTRLPGLPAVGRAPDPKKD